MKRFGLRALAGMLATLMVVSAFAPAKAASAADDILLIAPNPNALKTLYITEDMVDEDGEIVISGGSYDRVVVAKEVAAKDIYFDQVTVGEMVVESGGESRIQLWEVDAEQVTVQEPELEALSLLDIKDLLKDEETRDVALQMYKESKEKDAKTKKAAPKIVTKEDAQVETLVARANVTLDLADGEVNEVALEGSEKVDRAKVTLKNYTGDVSFKGTEGKSNMTLNNVDSRIKTLKVEESNANNYFAVNARNSVVLKAEVAGNARFALNALTGALEVTEEATAANITLLNTIEEMSIAGDNAVIDVAPCGRVETAAITGDKANVSGSGTLVAVEITGEGAYVSTFGTDVEGENTYVPPVYVAPVPEGSEFSFDTLSQVGYGVTCEKGDGSVTITFTDGIYNSEAQFVLPKTFSTNNYTECIVKATSANGKIAVKLIDESGATIQDSNYAGPAYQDPFTSATQIKINLTGSVYADKTIAKIGVMANDAATTKAVINSVMFVGSEDGGNDKPSPEISKEVYTVSEDFTADVGDFAGRGDATATVVDGAMYVSGRTANWHGAAINLDKVKTIGRTLNVSFKVKYDDDTAGTVKSTLNTSSSAYAGVTSTEIAKADEWVTVTGSMSVPADAEYVTFYFEADSTTASFYIDDVVISTEEITDDMLTEPDDGGGLTQPAENIVYDFENGIAMVSGNGATAAQAATKVTGENVLKLVGNQYGGSAAGIFATKLPDGKTLADMTSVKFDYYIVTEGISYKRVRIFAGAPLDVSADGYEKYINIPSEGYSDFKNAQTWETCETPLDATKVSGLSLAAGAEFEFGIGLNGANDVTYYIDNVRLVDANGDEYLLEDFEGTAPELGVINWNVEASVSNTVDLSAYGESMVQVTNAGWGQGIKFSFTLPEGKTIADYKGLQMNVFLPADAVPVDGQDFLYKDLRVAAGTGDYVALPEGTDYVGWESKGNVGSWVLVDVANWDTLVTAIGEATTFNIAVGVNTPCQTPYYIDNVVLVAK